jgi:hypothetical protein
MRRCQTIVATAFAAVLALHAQSPEPRAPRVWNDEALKTWALPIAGVNATPNFYREAEYYTAKVDELRSYPVYRKDREPKDYRESLLKLGPRPLVDVASLKTEADWIAAGQEVFDGMFIAENVTDDPKALAWVDDPSAALREQASVTRDGVILALRWTVDRDRTLKLTFNECAACHTRLLPDGTIIRGAQGNLKFSVSVFGMVLQRAIEARKREGRLMPPAESAYASFAVPWLKDDINLGLRTMPDAERQRIDGPTDTPGTFSRFNGSPYFTNHMPDLIGVKDRKYLDATATHRNRGPEDIARYGILVTEADDGAIGKHTFITGRMREIPARHSDEAMLALGRFIYALQPPPNPNRPSELTMRGEQVFARSGCATCHTPPLYTNNKIVKADGFTPVEHPQAPPPEDVMAVRVGTDPGLALRTRKGTGYYKVPSLKGLWYRDTLEHSGSIASLEEWFDPARLRGDYRSKGWNPPGTKTRAIPGHAFGLTLPAEDKQALIAFLRTL